MASETIMKLRSVILSFGLLACCGLAHAQVDLSELSHGMAGPRTEVLVLGTAHLSTPPKSFNSESLQPLLARVLAIVGATHKPWLDEILGQIPNVCIVDAERCSAPATDMDM